MVARREMTKDMRVGIDATCWSNRRGYGRFTRSLLGALFEADTAHEYLLFVDAQTHARGDLPRGVPRVVVPTTQAPTDAASADGRRSARDLLAMTAAVARHRLDAFFFPSVYTYFPLLNRTTIILGVHDVIAEDYPDLVFPDRRGRRLWALKGRLAHRQADYILTVSEHAKGGILRHFGHPSERVWVVDEAPDPVFRPMPPAELDRALLQQHAIAPEDRFFLYLGGVNPHKNLALAVEALAEVRRDPAAGDARLVIVGDIRDDGFTPGLRALRERIAALDMAESVRFTGFLPDAEVVHLLNAAQAVVLPSFAEGFGLPAVEGAACGVPVIATRNSPLPDLLAGGGIFVDPTNRDQLTEAVRRLLTDPGERRLLGRGALRRAQELTWRHSVEQMTALLDAIARGRR